MLQINPITSRVSFLGKIQNNGNIKKPLALTFRGTDTFEREKKPEKSSFTKWAEDTKFLQKGLKETLQNEENIIGKGFFNIAYKIPNNEDYILRMSNYLGSDFDYENASIEEKDQKLSINIGQPVAEIKMKSNDYHGIVCNVEVLRKQKGKSIGNPPPTVLYNEYTGKLKEGEKPYEDISRKERYAKSLHQLKELPASAYEDLIDVIQEAQKNGYGLDYLNSNNLLLDVENKSINPIDMDYEKSPRIDYGGLLYMLTNIGYFSTYSSTIGDNTMSNEKIKQAVDDTLVIVDKYIKAMVNKGVKVKGLSPQFMDFLNSFPCAVFCRSFNLEDKLEKFKELGIC